MLRRQVKTVSYDDGVGSLAVSSMLINQQSKIRAGRISANAQCSNECMVQGEASRPSAREVSLRLSLPSSTSERVSGGKLSCLVTCIGQFFADEIGLTESSLTDQSPILVPKCDPQYDPKCSGAKSLPFKRSVFNTSTPEGRPRQQINSVTAFIDGDSIYGPSSEASRKRRKYRQVCCNAAMLNSSLAIYCGYSQLTRVSIML